MDVEVDHFRDPELKCARVKYPDGTYKQFDVDGGCQASALFRQVTAGMSYRLKEREHFALCFHDPFDGSKHWLDNYREIGSQLAYPEMMRFKDTLDTLEPAQRTAPLPNIPWEFSFEVRFYPISPSTFVDDIARNFLFMQLRHDILSGRLTAEPDIHIRLGALLAQIVYGDAPYSDDQDYKEFMTQTKLIPGTVTDVNPQLLQLHANLRGLTPSDAINQYMDLCSTLPFYGVHFYPAKRKNGVDVMFGLGPLGISIQHDGRLSVHCKWSEIKFRYPRYRKGENKICWSIKKDDETKFYYTYRFSDVHLHTRMEQYITDHILFERDGTIYDRRDLY